MQWIWLIMLIIADLIWFGFSVYDIYKYYQGAFWTIHDETYGFFLTHLAILFIISLVTFVFSYL